MFNTYNNIGMGGFVLVHGPHERHEKNEIVEEICRWGPLRLHRPCRENKMHEENHLENENHSIGIDVYYNCI